MASSPEIADAPLPDALSGHWVDTRAPRRLRPYALLGRFDRPIGWWLLFWPGAWSIALAGGVPQRWPLLAWFLIGSITMRASGCVYNDIVDRDLDAQVARTRAGRSRAGQCP